MEAYKLKKRLQQDETRDNWTGGMRDSKINRNKGVLKCEKLTCLLPSEFALPGDILAFPICMQQAQGSKLSESSLRAEHC